MGPMIKTLIFRKDPYDPHVTRTSILGGWDSVYACVNMNIGVLGNARMHMYVNYAYMYP